MINEKIIALINREIDDDLSDAERIELNEHLASSETARRYQADLKSMHALIKNLPSPAFPDGLHEAIVGRISLAAPAPKISMPNRRSKRVRFGLATAAGLFLAVAVYQFGGQVDSVETDFMTGTVAPGHGSDIVLDRYSFETDDLSSSVRLLRQDSNIVMRVNLESTIPVELTFNFSGSNLHLEKMTQVDSELEVDQSADQVIRVNGRGQHEFSVFLNRSEAIGKLSRQTIALEYSSNEKIIRQAELVARDE